MRHRGWRILALATALGLTWGSPELSGQVGPPDRPRKVLVELFTSQGCSSCPPASDLSGRLAKLGYGPDRVVTLNFHVDYFNRPWVDPYSDPAWAARQGYYNEALHRRDLSFTPLMMVDGRHPLVGSDRSKALAALEEAGREPAGVSLDLALNGKGARRSLSVKVASRSRAVDGRELLVGVALAESRVTTKVTSGENAGRTLVEHQVVRRFVARPAMLEKSAPKTLTVPVEIDEGWDAERFRVSVFVQDRRTGAVHQADSVPWLTAEQARELRASRERLAKAPKVAGRSRPKFVFNPTLPSGSGAGSGAVADPADAPPTCPDCGTPLTPGYIARLPAGFHFAIRHLFPQVPPPDC